VPLSTGSPDPQVVCYAIQRGEYDQELATIAYYIQKRRDNADMLGIIRPSRGDYVEIWDDDPTRDVHVPSIILGAKLRVVGFRDNGDLRCQVQEPRGKLEKGAIVKIKRDWVYRVHFRG
jgi:hypothetical protein